MNRKIERKRETDKISSFSYMSGGCIPSTNEYRNRKYLRERLF